MATVPRLIKNVAITSVAASLALVPAVSGQASPSVQPLHTVASSAFIAQDESAAVVRVDGENRYATAAALALRNHGAATGTVYLASGEDFPDALTGGAVAAGAEAPLLLTRQDDLPDATVRALRQLSPERVVVLGGPASVSQATARRAASFTTQSQPSFQRLSGPDRYGTAAQIARALSTDDPSVVLLTTGEDFTDALIASAAAPSLGAATLLTAPQRLPAATARELSRLQPEQIIVVGTPADVNDSVLQSVRASTGAKVTRVAGETGPETAALVSQQFSQSDIKAFLASSASFPDALAASSQAGAEGAPILLTDRRSLPSVTAC